jgi:hypothetical protein
MDVEVERILTGMANQAYRGIKGRNKRIKTTK